MTPQRLAEKELPAVHRLKCWIEYYEQILTGAKTFEIRKNDRDFRAGDELILQEWNPEIGQYTGREVKKSVSYILYGSKFGVENGHCVMALSRTDIPDLLEHVKGLEKQVHSLELDLNQARYELKQIERLTLTVDQIKDLAEFAGLKVECEITEDDKETEIVITKCPEQGVKDDDDSIVHYKHIAYLEEYPDEGVCGLGEQLKTLLEKGQQ